VKQVYRTRYEKPLLIAARCCHPANDLTYFTSNRQTNEQTDRQTEAHHHRVKSPHLRTGIMGLIINYVKYKNSNT